MLINFSLQNMDPWGKWEFSCHTEELLNKICLTLENKSLCKVSKDWLALLNYNSTSSYSSPMEVDISDNNPKEEEILNIIKEALESEVFLSETIIVGISVNSISRIMSSVKSYISVDECRFCFFCKWITCWSFDTLIKLALTLVVLPKMKETTEASACIIFSVKELAIKKPNQFCENVLIPLLFSGITPFNDIELLSRVFPVLPTPQKDMLILNFNKKVEFSESDWLLLYPLIKSLSQNSLLILLECIQKFSYKFTKSHVFGRFLVNFCKNLDLIGNKDVLREVLEKHQTLLKIQALKYLELI